MKEQELYGQYTFQPKIDKVSKTLVLDNRQDLLSENMSNPAAKQKFIEKHNKYVREQEEQCTFQP